MATKRLDQLDKAMPKEKNSMRRRAIPCATLLGVVAPLGALAADSTPSSTTTLFAGVSASNQDSQRIDGGMAFRSTRGTGVHLSGSRTEAEWDTVDFSSTGVAGKLTHDFGRFGLGAGVRHNRDHELSKSLTWLGTGFVDVASARVTATLESRATDFDDTPFTADGADLGLTGVDSVEGIASCSVDSRGYGLGFDLLQPRWSFYASAMLFDYTSYGCDTTVESASSGGGGVGNGGASPPGNAPIDVTRPPIVEQLAAPVIARFSGYSTTLIPRDSALLESTLMIGASFPLGDRRELGLELFRDSEEFADITTNTLLAYLAVSITRSFSADFTLGASKTDGMENTAFAGVRFSASIGN